MGNKINTNELLIKNGRVIDPLNNIDSVCDVLIEEGRICYVGKVQKQMPEDKVIEASGKIVCPGFIDMHVHFREPGDEEEETIRSGSHAAVAGGYTSVVCMPNTDPTIQDETSIEFVHRMGRQTRKTHVYAMGALTKDRKGVELSEMGLMAGAGAAGFTDDGTGVQDASVMRKALKYASMFGLVVSQHCQDSSLSGNGVINAGFNSMLLGLPGMSPLAEELMLWRDIQLNKSIRAKYHAQHISTKGSVDIIRKAKQEGIPVTCEVTPHHLLLNEQTVAEYDTNYKMNPPLRTDEDNAALKEAVKDGIIDALITDHAPHLQSEKELEFLYAPFGIIGLESALPLFGKALIEDGIIDWPELVAMLTCKPAEILGIDETKGSFTKGKWGDITIFDPEEKWQIDVNKFFSKARNCPFHGWDVKGKVCYTIVGGEVRYSSERD
ncbi:Dihydroorotase [Sedimentisphaera cyanobacteriorum]|uniref:Dihydroorotase n=1 Tax=Sedimentisphaera cyanobacteriorum TaxID=1940790 RepID=A0A1Q2HM93_9BACT|nr:dihydroorotase [Sedimentisphaera cyanobacteriorum]AQQ08353.1 Dihydroorotase [Sedimentisphaera cyanobacteriorum]